MRKLTTLLAIVVLTAGPRAAQQTNWRMQVEPGEIDVPRGTMVIQNLDELLRNEPDLVASKVKELVIMGNHYNGNEHNHHFMWHNTEKAAKNVIENWPTPLVFVNLGGEIMSGSGLKDMPIGNPVRMAYYLQLGPKFRDNASWDQIVVLYGVRGASGYFKKNTNATRAGCAGDISTHDATFRQQHGRFVCYAMFATTTCTVAVEPPDVLFSSFTLLRASSPFEKATESFAPRSSLAPVSSLR